MAIVLVLFCVWALVSKGNGAQADSGSSEIVIDLDKILGLDSLNGSVKSTNAQTYEEEYGIAYFEGTSAQDFAAALCEAAGGATFTDSWSDYYFISTDDDSETQQEDLTVNVYSNNLYYIYVEADSVTDEIHYFQVSVFDWEEAGEYADFFAGAMELLGYEYICENNEEDIDLIYESLQEFVQEIEDGNSWYTGIILFDTSCVSFFTDEYGYPTCEILAY